MVDSRLLGPEPSEYDSSDDFVLVDRRRTDEGHAEGEQGPEAAPPVPAASNKVASLSSTPDPSHGESDSDVTDCPADDTPPLYRLETDLMRKLTISIPSVATPPAHSSVASALISAEQAKKKKKKKKKGKKAGKQGVPPAKSKLAQNAAAASTSCARPEKEESGTQERRSLRLLECEGLGPRSIVDDLSAAQSPVDDSPTAESPSIDEEASAFISSYISNPEAKSNMVYRLTLLQSLIIELGLATLASALPRSIKAAKALLKTRAFLNVNEYISARGRGIEEVRKLLHPSRKALLKDIRKKKNAVPVQWVKEHGLQVLLVHWHRPA